MNPPVLRGGGEALIFGMALYRTEGDAYAYEAGLAIVAELSRRPTNATLAQRSKEAYLEALDRAMARYDKPMVWPEPIDAKPLRT